MDHWLYSSVPMWDLYHHRTCSTFSKMCSEFRLKSRTHLQTRMAEFFAHWSSTVFKPWHIARPNKAQCIEFINAELTRSFHCCAHCLKLSLSKVSLIIKEMEMKQDKNIWRVYLAASCQDNTNLHCNEDSCVCEWTAGFSFVPEPQVL